jgi:hypothetical protein
MPAKRIVEKGQTEQAVWCEIAGMYTKDLVQAAGKNIRGANTLLVVAATWLVTGHITDNVTKSSSSNLTL